MITGAIFPTNKQEGDLLSMELHFPAFNFFEPSYTSQVYLCFLLLDLEICCRLLQGRQDLVKARVRSRSLCSVRWRWRESWILINVTSMMTLMQTSRRKVPIVHLGETYLKRANRTGMCLSSFCDWEEECRDINIFSSFPSDFHSRESLLKTIKTI